MDTIPGQCSSWSGWQWSLFSSRLVGTHCIPLPVASPHSVQCSDSWKRKKMSRGSKRKKTANWPGHFFSTVPVRTKEVSASLSSFVSCTRVFCESTLPKMRRLSSPDAKVRIKSLVNGVWQKGASRLVSYDQSFQVQNYGTIKLYHNTGGSHFVPKCLIRNWGLSEQFSNSHSHLSCAKLYT